MPLPKHAWLVMIALLCCTTAAPAQDHDTSDWGEGPAAKESCSPECRSGFQCIRGECLPICNPECDPGFLCTEKGTCVRAAAPPASSESSAQPELWSNMDGCMPECRPSFVCIRRQCVSACNPLCPEGEVCTEHGECVPAPPEAGPAPRDPSLDSQINVHFDALGLVQFGLTPTVEFGKRLSGYVRLRIPNTGLMSYVIVPKNDAEFHWGLGGTLGLHYFSSKDATMRGVFGGLALEYLFMRTREEKRYFAAYGTHALIPELDLGYRWGFGSFLLGVGGRIGLSIPAGKYDRGLGSNGCRTAKACEEERDLLFAAGLFLDLGWFL